MDAYRAFAQHLDSNEGPRRIVSLDGGGLRGMMTMQVLNKIETLRLARLAAALAEKYVDAAHFPDVLDAGVLVD